jgi:hypothetical protein
MRVRNILSKSMAIDALNFSTITREEEAALLSSAAAFCIAGLVMVFVPKIRTLE